MRQMRWVVLMTALVAVGASAAADDGATTFAQRCAVCHGPTAAGQVGPDIRCHRSIAQAVRAGRAVKPTPMPPFPDLSDEDLAAVQAWLRTTCPNADGPTLYRTHCARCHGVTGDGTRTVPPAACATRLADALGRGRDAAMPAFPGIDPTEVASLQAFLDDRCAARKRPIATVYAANCGTCHGATGAGGKNARGVEGPDIRCTARDDFADAVERGWGGMPKFPGLSHPMVEALFARVHGRRCAPPSR